MNPIHECHPFHVGRPISPMYDRSRPLSEILMATPTGFGNDDGEGDDAEFVDFVDSGGGGSGGRLLSSFKPAVVVPPPPPPKPTQVRSHICDLKTLSMICGRHG